MWRRILCVPRFPFLIHLIWWLNRCIPGYKKHVIPFAEKMETYKCIFHTQVDTPVFFTQKEERFGRDMLKKMGILADKPFVCFLARDPTYLNFVFPKDDFYYHNYRDVAIENYYLMAQKLAEKGYFVIRMGAKVHKPFATDNPMIIDYATKYRSEFLDIYLSAKCTFFVSSNAGLDEVPKLFKRPTVYTNMVPLGVLPVVGEVVPLFIPRRIRLKSENRFLTFREILNSKLALALTTQKYKELGVELAENTPEEISALALEMDEMNRGVWSVTDEDERLQERFRSIFRVFEPRYEMTTRVGRDFLRQNKQLLG
jgi:putative glycosyltransferase (TIGR04372 family)